MNAMPIEDMSTTYLEHSMVIHNRFEIPKTEDREMQAGSSGCDLKKPESFRNCHKGDDDVKRILIVEDDMTMNKMLADILHAEGYRAASAHTVAEAQQCFQSASYDLAILDINLSDGSGYEICKMIRKKASTAVIFLTANDLEQDMIKGYELGAADYITKPFPNSVLRHKIKAIFSMLESAGKEPPHKVYDDGQLMIDFSSMQSTLNGNEVVFAPLEYRMLEVFTKNRKILLTRQKLLESLWDSQENYVDEHTLTAAISRIRGKIEKEGTKYIRTVYGMGYMFIGGKAT